LTNQIDAFWSAAAGAPLVVLTDFDFTISQVDVGDLITKRLAPPSPETRARYGRGEIGTRLYWLDSIVRVNQTQAEALADSVAIDPSFPPFVAWCRQEQIPLAVVSDGFGFYIRRILAREGLGDLPIFCNEMVEAGQLLFPNRNDACDHCGCCKAQVSRRALKLGNHVLYAGDGRSDLYAARYADWVFAKGYLATYLAEHGSPYYDLDSFSSVQQSLTANLLDFKSGRAPRRASLQPDPKCRFTAE
jgi:2-hydroxy-3-keto-5-methylthiopentenyl-1-phosphate phosphatase